MTPTFLATLPRTAEALRRRVVVAIVAVLAMVVAPAASSAAGVERSGKEVVEASCFACHGSGADGGAPKIGDRQAWSKRAAQGLTSLTQAQSRAYGRCRRTEATPV